MVAPKLGIRNLARNRWRSGLTLAAIAVAVGLMVWTLAFYEGWLQQMVQGATAVETAQVQVHTAAYADKARVYRSFPTDTALYTAIRSDPEVVAISPRILAAGLLGNEQRSQVVRLLGVDPVREAETTPVADAVTEGRWLAASPPPYPAPREIVIGEGVARQLRVAVGAELVVFLEASDGSLGNELLRVVGIVRTGNTLVDRMSVYLHLDDAATITALDGSIHELAIRTRDLSRARETAAALALRLDALEQVPMGAAEQEDERLVVQPWQALLPAIDQMVVLFRRSYWFMYLLIYMVAGVGILNTQRMSALERRREFGVMMAIGMRPRRMFRTLQVETAVLGLVGALIGAILGGALAWYHSTAGLSMSLFTDQVAFSYMGVSFSDRMYSVLRPAALIQPIAVMVVFALLCGLWPAYRAARIDPVPAISGRT
ncbi:MAG: FtsX-like permease family protein [Gemmatimonadota bacterium]